MLKKIPVSSLRVGMRLHKLDCAWMAHPFWRARFVIKTEAELAKLHASAVAECWIELDESEHTTTIGGALPSTASLRPSLRPFPSPSPLPSTSSSPSPSLSLTQRPLPSPSPRPANLEPAQVLPTKVPTSGVVAAFVVSPLTRRHREMRNAALLCQRTQASVKSLYSDARLGRSLEDSRCAPMVEEITQSLTSHPDSFISLLGLKPQSSFETMHSVAVCALMVAMARKLSLGDDTCRQAGVAGMMHDIGKALVPNTILSKPGRLTEEEFSVVRLHTQQGHQLLQQRGAASATTLDVVLHHHERVDGLGYPERLVGYSISLPARMAALCDVYDAVTSNRAYKSRWDPAEALARMVRWKGQFDPALFETLVQVLGIYPTGSVVRLESGRLAVVFEQNPDRLISPVVKVFYSSVKNLPITPQMVDLSRPGNQDRIVSRQVRVPGQFPWLDELWADREALRCMEGCTEDDEAVAVA